ncbi:uncharacterized protein LOC129946772 [Eupeodes corollae]|uniref:uncharacterized protein LOC129946772 n=1 Tax=Eupeodes corollae TaxID=290404 RepID=UPI002493B02A|nr:uncharacterized protein LOC129946772 [Eupeodes corollae]
MKFSKTKLCIWLCIILVVNQASSESAKQLVDDVVLPLAIKIVPALSIPPPVGPIIVAGLSVLQIASNFLKSDDKEDNSQKEVENPITKLDLKEFRENITEQFETMESLILVESTRIIRELLMAIETNGFFEDLRQTVDYLQRTFADMNDIVIDPQLNGTQKHLFIDDMLSYSSDYRYKLRSFVSKFIKANVNELMLFKQNKLFYDFILEKQSYMAASQDDCSLDSMHNKMYKSFLYMIKLLTDGYSMAVSAHIVKYQDELKYDVESAEELANNALWLIDEYKKDIKTLIETTKSALEKAPREIRNCGTFDLIEGKTFERVSFSHMLPKIFYFEYIDAFYYKCRTETDFANLTNYDFVECRNYTDLIPFGSQLKIPLDIGKRPLGKGPFNFMKVKLPDETEEVFGHFVKKGGPEIQYSFKNHPDCFTTFCSTYRKNLYAISMKRVTASPGNVITGLRFRVRKRVIYIDIQEGKFSDILTVDPKTVHWTETPESNQIQYLGSGLNKFELGDFQLRKNSLLTSVQFTKGLHKGLIRVFIDGLTPPNMNNTDSVSYENNDLELNELQLSEGDNPTEMGNVNSKNMISKPPVPDQRYFVTFQPSDFKKDFGQSTIPLLDIREVVSNPPAPLNGFGFYHEAVSGSGGLIAIKLITPKLTDHLDVLSEN